MYCWISWSPLSSSMNTCYSVLGFLWYIYWPKRYWIHSNWQESNKLNIIDEFLVKNVCLTLTFMRYKVYLYYNVPFGLCKDTILIFLIVSWHFTFKISWENICFECIRFCQYFWTSIGFNCNLPYKKFIFNASFYFQPWLN